MKGSPAGRIEALPLSVCSLEKRLQFEEGGKMGDPAFLGRDSKRICCNSFQKERWSGEEGNTGEKGGLRRSKVEGAGAEGSS